MLTRQQREACQPGATSPERVRGTTSALKGRRIPAPLRGAPIDSETQGVALGYHAAAPSAPEPKLYKPEFRSFDGWPFMRWLLFRGSTATLECAPCPGISKRTAQARVPVLLQPKF